MTPIGAWVTVHFVDEADDKTHKYYFSFGQYADDADTDEFGVPDTAVFYYCFEGEDELKLLMQPSPYSDFVVRDYETVTEFSTAVHKVNEI